MTEDYLPGIAPVSIPEKIKDFFNNFHTFYFQDYLRYLKKEIPDEISLSDAPAIINNRKKLDAVFYYMAKTVAKEKTITGKNSFLNSLDGVPLCLDMDEELYAFGKHSISLAGEYERNILKGTDEWLVDEAFQSKHYDILEKKLKKINIVNIVDYLKEISPECKGKLIEKAHFSVNSWKKLTYIYDYLIKNKASDIKINLKGIALCPDESEILHEFGGNIYLAYSDLRKLLDGTGLAFVNTKIQTDQEYSRLLSYSGIKWFTPSIMISLLQNYFTERMPLNSAHIIFNNIEKLKEIYEYFYKNKQSLGKTERENLRKLPFVLTEKGNLGAIDDKDLPLLLPPGADISNDEQFQDVLKLDNLINSQILEGDLRDFFEDTLKVERLSRIGYIKEYIIRYYEDQCDDAKLKLLHIIKDSYSQLKKYGVLEKL
ncbi:MAG: hypothetical protein ABRQ39_27710, partial [Candidatus Eremiobacterota bacterium]